MTKKSKKAETSTIKEKTDNGSAAQAEGVMVTTIASFLAADPDLARSVDQILENYLEARPRSRADVYIGKREIAAVCLHMLAKGYVTKHDDDSFKITESGQGLV
jgi:hypothetical protein